ncbi:hypothetical protein [Fibrobacter sp. UWT2]|uniref:hypothetical protein n=1 Tax=Fibrobacter sp. UWT2 TaxID=1896224 RepID=UPI0011604C79|nr:hypothetical protein [Fibrobacter sp. UWT2]
MKKAIFGAFFMEKDFICANFAHMGADNQTYNSSLYKRQALRYGVKSGVLGHGVVDFGVVLGYI